MQMRPNQIYEHENHKINFIALSLKISVMTEQNAFLFRFTTKQGNIYRRYCVILNNFWFLLLKIKIKFVIVDKYNYICWHNV